MKEWKIKPFLSAEQKLLQQHLNIPPLIAQLLINRGYAKPDDAQAFLFHSLKDLPSPFLLKDMDKAVDRLMAAISKREKIVVYGDYDVDGTSGTTLLFLFFKALGHPIEFYIPNRLREGYSLNAEALKKLKAEGAHLIITVDNGVSANAEALLAREWGLDLIITDHHECPAELPMAKALINPHQEGCGYPAKEICGTGVAFNLALGLRQRLRESGYFGENRPEPNMKQYLDLVALATVADVVSLVGVNRIFVKIGLEEISRSARPGMVALKEVCDLSEKITATDLGFRLGPRVNACGRLYDASMGVRLLISENLSEARKLAEALNGANQERQSVEKNILKEAIDMLESDSQTPHRMGHVLYREHWHPGVIGIVASRLVEKYCRPVVMLGQDGERLKGSARSFGGVNLIEVLRECHEHLVKCGGHKAAAGVTLLPEKLESFGRLFDEKIRRKIDADQFVPYLKIDAELSLSDINSKLLDELKQLEPHGMGNPAPLFCLKGVRARGSRVVGEKHLKFSAHDEKKSLNAIAFRMADQAPHLTGPLDLAFSCELNIFQGVSSIVLNVKDIRKK